MTLHHCLIQNQICIALRGHSASKEHENVFGYSLPLFLRPCAPSDCCFGSSGTCDFCHNIIIGDFVNCMNKYFHPEHIYCQNCKKRDPNNRYFEKDRQVVCSSCQIQKYVTRLLGHSGANPRRKTRSCAFLRLLHFVLLCH